MRQEDSRAAEHCRIRKNRPNGQADFRDFTVITSQVKAVRISIDVGHPQALSSGIGLGKATRKERAGRLQSVQLERLCGTLIAHPD